MKIKIMILTFCMIVPLGVLNADALLPNNEYVFLGEGYFFVFELDKEKNVFPVNGGVLYESHWHPFNMTSLEVEIMDEDSEQVWIIGNLMSGEQVWFSWDLKTFDQNITGIYVYNGTHLTEKMTPDTYLTRLFYLLGLEHRGDKWISCWQFSRTMSSSMSAAR